MLNITEINAEMDEAAKRMFQAADDLKAARRAKDRDWKKIDDALRRIDEGWRRTQELAANLRALR